MTSVLMQIHELLLLNTDDFTFANKTYVCMYVCMYVCRLISDTSVYLIAVTFIASLLHLVFEFLAFQVRRTLNSEAIF